MSKLDEVLERTRAETPDEEEEAAEEETPEPEPEPEPEQPDEPEASAPPDVDVKKVEAQLKRHEKAMTALLGDGFADMERCPTCDAMGYVPRDFTPPPPILANPDLVVCADCNGHTVRRTPSLNEQYAFEPCTKCMGKGYVDRAVYEMQVASNIPATWPTPPAPPPAPVWDQARGMYVDQFGQPLIASGPPLAPAVNGPGTP